MGLRVTAAQAATLVDRHERLVRWHLKRGTLPAVKDGRAWAIDVSDLEAVPGWRVHRDRLADLEASDARSAVTLAARLATLERDVQALRARIRVLEAGSTGAIAAVRASDGQEGLSGSAGVSSIPPGGYRAPVEPVARSFSMTYAARASDGTFRTRSDAARWLVRHGVNEHTPKTWAGWRDVSLEPRAMLEDALRRYDPANWRITWRLNRCGDPACVCVELLP